MTSSDSLKVFQLKQTAFRRVAYLAAILVVIAGTVALSAQQIAYGWDFDSWLLIGFFLGCCAISLIVQYRASTARLMLSDTGIAYRGPYSTIRADSQTVSVRPNRFLPDLFGPYRLVLATPPSQMLSLAKWLLAMFLGIGPLPIALGPRLWENYDRLMDELAMHGVMTPRK